MKKNFFMLVSFLCMAFAAQAQTAVTDLSQLSNDKVYTLRSARCFLFYSEALPGEICSSNGKLVGTVTRDNSDPNQLFRIEKNGSSYYLYSVGAGKYVSSNGSFEATASAALTLTKVSGTYPWKLLLGGNGMNSQEPNQMDAGIVVNTWTTTDAGNCYIIEEGVAPVSDFTVTVLGTDDASAGVVFEGVEYKNGASLNCDNILKRTNLKAIEVENKIASVSIDGATIYASYFDASTKFYTIMNGKGGFVSMNPEYLNGGNMLLTNSNTPRDNQGIWAFVASGSAYKVYNFSTGLAKVLGMTGSDDAARATMVATDNTSYTTTFDGTIDFTGDGPSYIKKSGTTSEYWNRRDDGNGGGHLALWNSTSAVGDVGSQFFLDEVNYADYPDEYIHEISDIEGVSSYSPKNPNTLWYTTSAEAAGVSYPWMEYALPLGNGELGCMVFGGVRTEELQFNEKTLWSGPANSIGQASGSRTFMNFGSLFITNNDNAVLEGVTDYVRYLDIEEGIAGVEFKNANGTKQIRKYFSSAPEQVIAGQYKNEGEDKLNLIFMLEPGTGIGAGDVTAEGNAITFTGAMTAVNYAARLHVVADDDATVAVSGKNIVVKNASEVTFYLKGATNFNGDMNVFTNYFTTETPAEVNNRVKSEIEDAIAKGFAAIEADHIADFTAITKRMTFDLGLTTPTVDTKALVDKYYPNNSNANSTDNDHLFLEQLYFHYGRYLAISSNRKPIAAPNNLQGIWNDRGTDSPWNSDIHTNINIQMNYWPTEVTNLSDLHKPFVNFILRGAQSEGWQKVARDYNNGSPGWSVMTESSLYNSMSTWGSNYLVANAWYTSHLWTHYRYTQDKDFLKQAFPVMWSCAEFWFHRLKLVNGEYLAPNEYSAEHGPTGEDGTAHAQQMISYLFQNLKDAIDILGADELGLSADDIAKLDDYLAKIDKGLAVESCALANNGVTIGTDLLREWKYSAHTAGDLGHRHMSHLMALFPMDQITPESEYFEPAVNSLRHRGDAATGWSMGWKVNLWARAQDGDHAHLIIKNALKHSTSYGTDQSQGGIYYNLFDSHAPFQIDGNFGVCSGMAEMLLQSAHGYINILPALPAVWEKVGNVKGMKAIGNFTVDFSWANGKCQWARIVSNAGADLRVRCNRGATDIASAKIIVDGATVSVEVDANGIATIPCVKNSVVEIEFAEGTLGIDGVAQTTGNGEIYDISGRRVTDVAKGQVYIQDGVKKLSR